MNVPKTTAAATYRKANRLFLMRSLFRKRHRHEPIKWGQLFSPNRAAS